MEQKDNSKKIRVDEDVHTEFKVTAVQLKRTLRDCANEALRQWLEQQRREEGKDERSH